MQTRKVWPATTILGSRVRVSSGDEVGRVEDLAIDPASDRILYGILSVDGFPEMFVVPWSSFRSSNWPNYAALSIDRRTLESAPSFNPANWPNLADTTWDRRIRDHYGAAATPVHERTVYVERPVTRRRGPSVLGTALLIVLLVGLLWAAFLVSTRGWERAKDEIAGAFSGAAYAMRETSSDAALTAKVKTALSLSKRIPAGQINVDSKDDVVTLRGEVPSEEIRKLAEEIASDTPGVREVHNHLYALTRTQ